MGVVEKAIPVGGKDLTIPVMMIARNTTPYYDNAANANTGGTMIANQWKKMCIERFGVSNGDVIGYPAATVTNINVKIIGFTDLESAGTILLTTTTSVTDLDISGYSFIKIVGQKSATAGDTFSAVNVVFSN